MRFRKFLICIFTAIIAFNVCNITVLASEDVKETKEANEVTESKASKDTKDNKDARADKAEEEIKESYSEADLRLLSALIYCEAQSEIYRGKIAVGIVVMNRVRSDKYPNTIKEVIYQKNQFSPASSGSLKKALEKYDKGDFTSEDEIDCIKAAKHALNGVTSLTINDEKVDFSEILSFSGRLKGYKIQLGNHQFK